MNTLTQAERLMKLETNVENLDKKVEIGFADIKGDLKELAGTVQQLVPTLVTQTQLTEKVADLTTDIASLKVDLANAKRKNNYQVWVTSTSTAVLAVVLTILIQNYFKG